MKRPKDKPRLKKRTYTPPKHVRREWSAHIMEHYDGTATFKEFKDDVETAGKLKVFDATVGMSSKLLEDVFQELVKHGKTAGVSGIQMELAKVRAEEREKEVAATLLDQVRMKLLSVNKNTDPVALRMKLLDMIK